MPVRPRFDPKRSLSVARAFTFLGRPYAIGDTFPHADDAAQIPDRLRARQYEARVVNFAPEADPDAEPVQMKPAAKNGRWDITAPWLDEPITVRGKKNAETKLAEVREAGAPLGWIEGGSEVEVTEQGGGWFEISAPWLEEAEKVQGREDAEKRQREIHDAGEPATHHGVTLTEAENGNGYFDVKADWWAAPETVHGIDEARRVAAELRAEGPPEGWTPESGIAADPDAQENSDNAGTDNPPADGEKADEGATTPDTDEGAQAAADGAQAQEGAEPAQTPTEGSDDAQQAQAADVDALVTATHTGGGYYEIAAPWMEKSDRVRGKDKAEAARVKIVEAGPPEGWTPATA